MQRTSVQIFKHFDGNFVLFLRQFLEKLEKNYGEKYAIIGIDMDMDTFPITRLNAAKITAYNKQSFK